MSPGGLGLPLGDVGHCEEGLCDRTLWWSSDSGGSTASAESATTSMCSFENATFRRGEDEEGGRCWWLTGDVCWGTLTQRMRSMSDGVQGYTLLFDGLQKLDDLFVI